MPRNNQKIKTLIENLQVSRPNQTVVKAFNVEEAQRMRTYHELTALFALVKTTVERWLSENDSEENEPLEALKQKILKQVKSDLETTKAFNQTLSTYSIAVKPQKENECTFPLKFNKLATILEAVQLFLNQHFKSLAQGQAPDGYDFQTSPNDVACVEWDEKTIYGNPKATFLKAALLAILKTTNAKPLSELKITLNETQQQWVGNTAIAYLTPLPKAIVLPDDFSFVYTDLNGQKFLIIPHSGYGFGAGRDYPTNSAQVDLEAFVHRAHDCSSFLEFIYGLAGTGTTLTTLDELYLYRTALGTTGLVTEDWRQSTGLQLTNRFNVVENWEKNPQEKVKPGSIWAIRRFNLETDKEKIQNGAGGHTAVVLGFNSDAENSHFITLGDNRDVKEDFSGIEGIGVTAEKMDQGPAKLTMLFDLKQASERQTTDSSSLSSFSRPVKIAW